MNIMIYLCFTIVSVMMQFVIMDILDANQSYRKQLNEILSGFEKPHALSYQVRQSSTFTPAYSNSSIQPVSYEEMISTTPVTILDILYDSNTNITEIVASTEAMENDFSTEYFNSTEFSIFPNISIKTTKKPSMIGSKKIKKSGVCQCNLLYNACDINCFCDVDCSSEEQNLFNCSEYEAKTQDPHVCHEKTQNNSSPSSPKSSVHSLWCVVKTNLPARKNTIQYSKDMDTKVDIVIPRFMTWQHNSKAHPKLEYSNKLYVYNDPIWLWQNETVFSLDLPTSNLNSHCSVRKPILFLKDLHYKCLVKVQDLEMFNIYETISISHIISFPDEGFVNVVKNCSSLHCVPWKITICDTSCQNYNKTLHEPICTDQVCTNMAQKIEYVFHCNNSKIIDALLYLHVKTIPFKTVFVEQEIKVKFFLIKNKQQNKIVQLSGNPGYIIGLPVIVSFRESNFTDGFFSSSSDFDSRIIYPENIQGYCILTNVTYKAVKFGYNMQNKCRHTVQASYTAKKNATENCQTIQKNVYDLLRINTPIYVSSMGNPRNLKDEDWIELEYDIEKGLIHGELKNNMLRCYNLAAKLSYIFTFADTSKIEGQVEQNILDAKAYLKVQDILLFEIEDTSTVITVETSFLDVTKPPVYKYAKGPRLDIHLPDDFFLPFAPNSVFTSVKVNIYMTLVCYAQLKLL